MKNKFILLIAVSLTTVSIFAQTPEKINYQAIARDASGNPMINSSLSVVFEIRLGSSSGSSVYSETHSPTTNEFGLFTSAIGGGTPNTPFTAADFANINWGSGLYYLYVNVNGDSIGTSQLLSVPYALYAKESANGPSGLDGLNCWDLNGDGIKDAVEDINNDGVWNALDCRGDSGAIGPQGPQGPSGPAGSYTSGTGIDLTSNIITNTAPDQTVTITGSGSTVVSGTYPNFSITSSDSVNDADADPNNERITTFTLNGTSDSLIIVEAGVGHAFPLSDLNDGDWVINGANITNGNSGNVGIGTTLPLAKNHINIVSPASRALYVTNGNSTPNNAAIVQFDANSSLTNAFRLERDGQIGIGIGTATAGLHLNNTLRLENMSVNAPDTGFVLTAMDANGNAEWQPLPSAALSWPANGNDIYNTNIGNVGIGISTPNALLHIHDINASPSDHLLNIGNNAGQPVFTVIDNGFVGINSGNPTVQFEVRESPGADRVVEVNGRNVALGDIDGGGAGANLFIDGDGTGNFQFTGGNVGIGTTAPVQKLQVSNGNDGAIRIGNHVNWYGEFSYDYGQGDLRITSGNTSTATGADIIFNTYGTDKMIINGLGNVGIGTLTPSEKLDIDGGGNIEVDGDYTYETPKTHYYSVAGNTFVGTREGLDRWDASTNLIYGQWSSGSATYPIAVAPINLPHGAVITNVTAYIYDNDGSVTYQPRIILYSINMTSGTYGTEGSATLAGNSASATPQALSFSPNTTINNQQRAYYLKFQSEGNAGSNIRLYGISITYTVTKAD